MTRRFDSMSVVGLSFRVPGAAELDTLHRVLGEERSLISQMPPARYAADPADYEKLLATERPGTFLGAWLDDVERFDARHFGVSPLEARRMDPQQRLSMEEAWRALEDAGLPPRSLAGSRTGVFVGASNHDYVLSLSRDLHAADVFKVMGNALGMISNRVSHALDLRGPSFTMDTACSSSFVALHQAMRSLQSREIDLALVGGVNLITSPHLSVAFSRARMLAADGRCKTFSDDADGYVRGEAVVFLALMRTEDARREGRRSHLDLLGSALNQDGNTPVVTAPKLEAQAAVIQEALSHAGLDASALSYVEAHGTGTPVGDPTEYEAMARVLESAPRERPCVVGSVKTRLGHAEPASGLVGLLKVISALKHDELHAHRNVRRLSPAASSPQLEIPLQARAWPRGEPRIAGVSSFGFGGTNAHVIVREAAELSGFVQPRLTTFGGERHWKKPARAIREELEQKRPREVLEELKRQLASLLLIPLEQVDAERPLLELGVDSLELFTLLQRVESRYGINVSLDRVLEPGFSLAQFAELVGTSEPRPSAPVRSGAFSMFAPRPPDEREAEPPSTLERETIELLTRRAPGSKAAAQRFRDVLADNRNTAGFRPRTKELTFPLVADRAEGSRLIDVDGNEWVDFSMGFGVHLFGHAPPFITSAVHEALQRGAPVGPQSPLAGEVARLLAELTGLERFTFTNSGTEAVMLACRLARAATRRAKIVVFEGAYHGTFDGLLGRPDGGPLTPGTTASMVADLVVLPWDDPASIERLRSEGGSIAAVLVEPVQSRRPSVQPVEFLRALREVTAANGTALIFDEVITGFRCATGGAQQRFGVKADLAIYGKVLGGGFPIGVVGGSARFLAGVDGGAWQYGDDSAPSHSLVFFAGTFCKHPVAMAAARAVLNRLKSSELLTQLEQRTQFLAESLNTKLRDASLPLEVHSFASLFRFHSARNLDLFFARLNAAGFYAWEGRTLFMSEAHGDQDLERFMRAVVAAAHATLGEEPVKVSGPQRRFLELPAGSRAGNVAFALRLEGELDVPQFESAIRQVLARHDIFRAQFDREQGTVRFGGPSRVGLETVRLAPGDRLEDRLERLAQTSFDVSHGPLAQFTLFDCGERRWCFALLAHGLLVDATSLSLLLGELAVSLKGPVQRPPAPSYREAMASLARVPAQALEFWLEVHARGLPAPRWPSGSARARRLKHVIGPENARKIREAARGAGVTAFTWLFTAFSRALGPGAAIVVPIADRRFPGGDGTVGNLTQLVAVPQPGEDSWSTLLAHNASLLPRCYEHARLSLSELCAALSAKGLPSFTPQVLFNLEPALRFPALATENGGRLTLEELDVPRPEARYAVSVNVLESDDGLRIDLDWLVDSLDERSARGLLERLVAEATR